MDKRHFLQAAASLPLLALPAGLLRAAQAGQVSSAHKARQADYPFSLGVASGSPLPDSVILWTRVLPQIFNPAASGAAALGLRWEVAHDQAFRQIAAAGRCDALPQLGHSVHVDVRGLQPGRWYWYRFMLGDAVSPTGRTRTAPAAHELPAQCKLALASCQHWEFGAFGAHRQIAASAPDLVAFLGDYIYEWGPYSLTHPASAARVDESFTLEQYRARYAQYKSDPDLQAAHHAAPWVLTWDDHEVANDYANLVDERLDPQFAARRAAAYQAYYEHLPLRAQIKPGASFASFQLYQSLDWGRLARLYLLDNRQYRDGQACLKPGQGGSTSVTPACRALHDARRSMLGRQQEAWLQKSLQNSPARWNLLLQQTIMARNSQLPVKDAAGGRYWTDGWDGYPAARQQLLQHLRQVRNPLVMSGDVHTFYASNLVADFNRPVSAANPVLATEFCGSSVTSPSRAQSRTDRYLADNPHTRFGRSDVRGFMLQHISPSACRTEYLALEDVRRADSALYQLAAFITADGERGIVRG
ncbi:alkaline phosphatase D family protein [Massilia sp. W12]|uniref:alkaline phosphatase D family protein n=1 Tax=Massilia sp. W12 TaxID=3126507 RepID=UPI0030D3140A